LNAEVEVHAAAFYLALMRAGELEAAADFMEWYLEEFDVEEEELSQAWGPGA
jgi:hypothetical protein